MPSSEALIVGEDWISEHYFTTDAKAGSFQAEVNQRRKQWDEDAANGASTVRARFTAARRDLGSAIADVLSGDADDLSGLYADLRKVLGYDTGEYILTQAGPVYRVTTPGLESAASLILVEARAAETVEDLIAKNGDTLLVPYETDDETFTSVARLLSELFVEDEGPEFALVLAGRWLLVAERARWAEGRYLAVDLQLICERNDAKRGGEIDRALTCVAAESLAPDAEGGIWWRGILEESVKHTVGVSQDLREGVRLSIEIIANEVVRRRKRSGLAPLPQDQAQPLARQSLRYLYRILFLLYAEASPELEVLPVGAEEYDQGYGLDRLRDLTLVELATPSALDGTHLYQSLGRLFELVDKGHQPPPAADGEQAGLTFNSLRADLFLPQAIALIDETGLGNEALQRVLRHLLLSKEARGKDRGFISYAELGINQLGRVYEGLMSYTGFFAETDLYEVAKGGNPEKGSWVVPVHRADDIDEKDFVRVEDEVTGEKKAVVHERGTFVFRLAGRERQQSASYYTPEVLTRFTVSQALGELLDQDGHTTTAEEILNLTVCEPALGSGAFAIEAVRQLAAQYLSRRQNELGQRIDPEQYPAELQRVKAYIALHQVYGVDLNSTAVELAEISLWLDTMVSGLRAPWFGLRLRRGNSLIGARREMDKKIGGGRIHHFLLPSDGWGSAVQAKEAVALAPGTAAMLKKWRSAVTRKPNATQTKVLVALADRVETLWNLTQRRLEIAEAEARRDIKLWGRDDPGHSQAVSREDIEKTLANPDGAYQRLRRVMDAWCALWFWPLTSTKGVLPPNLEQWISACQSLLGVEGKVRKGMTTLAAVDNWDDLNAAEELNLDFAGAAKVATVLENHPWLTVCADVAERQGFFHWELDFATVFARGGFDLQLGNPPWVRPRTDVDALLAEKDPWWQLALKPSEAARKSKRESTFALPGTRDLIIDGTTEISTASEYLGSERAYPLLAGLQPNLYRCFMEQTWRHSSRSGIVGLVHPETHFTDEKAGLLRQHTYCRLRRHWQFINELRLYEIGDQNRYGIHVYGALAGGANFLMASSIYHPDTVERSLRHDGSGDEPGHKDPNGNWDLRPHRKRIIQVTDAVLATWRKVTGDNQMIYTVNSTAADVLATLARQPRVSSLDLEFSRGWDESIDRKKGHFVSQWGAPGSWDDVILQGPHFYVATPMYKLPNPTMKSKGDWSATNFETLPVDMIPVTAYKPTGDGYPRDHYRVAWRRMAANHCERTLIPALIPPKAAHVNAVFSVGLPSDLRTLCVLQGTLSSLLLDFAIRAGMKGDIYLPTLQRLPIVVGHPLLDHLVMRTLRLNCVTNAYADLWREVYRDEFTRDRWASGRPRANRPELGTVGPEWTAATPLRIAEDRRQALVEIDALVALMLGVTADQLCTIYRTQFAVLYGYDHNPNKYAYDENGRLGGDTLLDREADMRAAYAEFERRLEAM